MAPDAWRQSTLGLHLREPIKNGYSPLCPKSPTGKWIAHLGAVTERGFNPAAVKPAPPDDPRVDLVLLQPGDLLVSRSNTRERVGLAGIYRGSPRPCSYPDLLMRVRTSGELDPDYLLHLLLADTGRAYFRRAARGTSGSMVKIDRALLEAFPITVPPILEQHRVAKALNTLDEAVSTSEAVVEQIGRAGRDLIDDILRRGLPGGGLRAAGWERGTLAGYLREPIRNGYSPVCPSEPTGRWTLSLSAVTPEGFDPDGKKPAPANDPRVASSRLLPGDIVVSRANGSRERVGLAGIYRGDPADCSYPDLLMRVRTSAALLPEFLECQLLGRSGRRYFFEAARGTATMVKINREMLEAFPVLVPPLNEQKAIVEAASAVTDRVVKERAVVAERRRLKAALADALLTGKIRVLAARAV